MNVNHYDPKVIYPFKLKRLTQNINYLQESASILQTLPLKIVQSQWRQIAMKELTKKDGKHKIINKGLYKQCLRKTIQAFINDQKEMKREVEERIAQLEERQQTIEVNMIDELEELIGTGNENLKGSDGLQ